MISKIKLHEAKNTFTEVGFKMQQLYYCVAVLVFVLKLFKASLDVFISIENEARAGAAYEQTEGENVFLSFCLNCSDCF